MLTIVNVMKLRCRLFRRDNDNTVCVVGCVWLVKLYLLHVAMVWSIDAIQCQSVSCCMFGVVSCGECRLTNCYVCAVGCQIVVIRLLMHLFLGIVLKARHVDCFYLGIHRDISCPKFCPFVFWLVFVHQ